MAKMYDTVWECYWIETRKRIWDKSTENKQEKSVEREEKTRKKRNIREKRETRMEIEERVLKEQNKLGKSIIFILEY